jgi:hypothetical protein
MAAKAGQEFTMKHLLADIPRMQPAGKQMQSQLYALTN